MKIRKQVRALHKTLCKEVALGLQEHSCGEFLDNGGVCVLCSLMNIRKIFAAIHLAREKGMHSHWFDAERSLYDLLGEKAFFNKIEIELKEVANFPRKECDNCRHIVTFFHPFKTLARSKSRRIKSTECNYCGNIIELKELPVLPPSKEKNRIKEDSPPKIRLFKRNPVTDKPRRMTLEEVGLSLIDTSQLSIPSVPVVPVVPVTPQPNSVPVINNPNLSTEYLTSIITGGMIPATNNVQSIKRIREEERYQEYLADLRIRNANAEEF